MSNLRPRRLWPSILRLLVNLLSWFFLAGVQEVGRLVFFVVHCLSKLHAIYRIIDSLSWGNLLFKVIHNFWIFHLWNRNFDPFSNFLFQLLLVFSRCLKIIIVLNTWWLKSVTINICALTCVTLVISPWNILNNDLMMSIWFWVKRVIKCSQWSLFNIFISEIFSMSVFASVYGIWLNGCERKRTKRNEDERKPDCCNER